MEQNSSRSFEISTNTEFILKNANSIVIELISVLSIYNRDYFQLVSQHVFPWNETSIQLKLLFIILTNSNKRC